MKVYIICRQPFPYGMAATNRIKCYAKALLEQSIDCEVITYIRTEFVRNKRNIESCGIFEGIPFKYIGGSSYRNKNKLIRWINDVIDKIRLYIYLKKNLVKSDIVFCYSGLDIDFILKLQLLVHSKGAKFVSELCELPYESDFYSNKTKVGYDKTVHKLFPHNDGIVAISETLVGVANKFKSSHTKVIKIPILVDFEKYRMQDKSDLSEFPYIFHSGTLFEKKDGIVGMLEAFGRASLKVDPSVKFISTGRLDSSPHKKEIIEIIKKYKLNDRVIFVGYLSDADLKDYLSKATIVIINKYKTKQNEYCFSTKLGEYLAASKPLIITNVGEAMNWLTTDVNAWIVEPEDKEALSGAIIYAFNHPNERKKIGIAGQLQCQRFFDYKAQSTILANFFNSI